MSNKELTFSYAKSSYQLMSKRKINVPEEKANSMCMHHAIFPVSEITDCKICHS